MNASSRVAFQYGMVNGSNIDEPVRAQHRHRPVAGARLRFRGSQARTNFSDQAFDNLVSAVARERRSLQSSYAALLRRRYRRGLRLLAGRIHGLNEAGLHLLRIRR